MRFVSAVADPKDAVGAVEPSFQFDFVAFLNNFSAKLDIFFINRTLSLRFGLDCSFF